MPYKNPEDKRAWVRTNRRRQREYAARHKQRHPERYQAMQKRQKERAKLQRAEERARRIAAGWAPMRARRKSVDEVEVIRRRRARDVARHEEEKARALAELGGCCAWCGIDDPMVLQFDHIAGDGNLSRRVHRKSGVRTLTTDAKRHGWIWVRERVQVLCANCHSVKTYHEKDHLKFRGNCTREQSVEPTLPLFATETEQ